MVTFSIVYRIGSVGVFDEPMTVQIPVNGGIDPNALEIYYFSESEEHRGWYRGEEVIGWMAPGSLGVVEEDGQIFVQLEVNHSGVVQLGKRASVNVGSVVSIDLRSLVSQGVLLLVLLLGFGVMHVVFGTKRRVKGEG